MNLGDDVAWHILGQGVLAQVHGVHFTGITLQHFGSRVTARVAIPGSALTLTSKIDVSGK